MKKRNTLICYVTILVILSGIAFVPVRECALLFRNVFSGNIRFDFANENLIIPFTSIVVAMFIGYALLPCALKYIKDSWRKAKITLLIFSALVFIGCSLFVESIALEQWDLVQRTGLGGMLVNETNVFNHPFDKDEYIFRVDGEYFKSRSVTLTRTSMRFYHLDDGRTIVWDWSSYENKLYVSGTNTPAYFVNEILPVVKIHYYIFSIVLIIVMLNFLFDFSSLFAENVGKTSKASLITQGLAGAAYLFAILFVRVIRYVDFDVNYITLESAISAVSCIVLAAIALGILSGCLLNGKIKTRLIPMLVSAFVVIVLYAAEYFMLGGGLYRYGEGFFFKPLILGVSVANIIVVLLPCIIVFFVLKILKKIGAASTEYGK